MLNYNSISGNNQNTTNPEPIDTHSANLQFTALTTQHEDNKCVNKVGKRPREPSNQNQTIKLPPKEKRYDRLDHFPGILRKKSMNKCRNEKCSLKTNYFCMKCNVYLCIKETKNCFLDFHTNKSQQ